MFRDIILCIIYSNTGGGDRNIIHYVFYVPLFQNNMHHAIPKIVIWLSETMFVRTSWTTRSQHIRTLGKNVKSAPTSTKSIKNITASGWVMNFGENVFRMNCSCCSRHVQARSVCRFGLPWVLLTLCLGFWTTPVFGCRAWLSRVVYAIAYCAFAHVKCSFYELISTITPASYTPVHAVVERNRPSVVQPKNGQNR